MPTIKKPNQYFDAVLWTGNGPSSQSITGLNFQPDLVWVKNRSSTRKHNAYDSVRGTSKRLVPDDTPSEDTVAGVTAFNSNGFTVGDEGDVNANTLTFVGWNWKAGGTSTVNTSGTISSNVSVSTTAGFSIITYTGNGSANATVGHGLGVTPNLIIVKQRTGTADNWAVSVRLSNLTVNRMYLNSNIGDNSTDWVGASSTTLTLKLTDNFVNTNGNNYVAYCWASIDGFSNIGYYTGNASTNGPFVYLGFKPKFVIIKKSSGAGAWAMFDGVRETYNPGGSVAGRLQADTVDAETGNDSAQYMDFLSNGFKIRSNSSFNNDSGGTYIYIAFAESPFKFTTAR